MAATIGLRLLICLLVALKVSSGVGDREKRQATTQPLLQSTCVSSSSPNPTPLHTTPTDCSLGEVNQSLADSGELKAGGLYLIPEAIACNGDLVFVETCAFLNRLMNTSLFRLRVVVYRERTDTHKLDRIYQQALNIRSNSSQDCGSLSRVPRQWSVNKGDRVGVQIRDTCDTPNGSDPACPAQANLIDASCASALYLPPHSSPNSLSDFTTVGVNLNVRVSIMPTTSQPLVQSMCISSRYVPPSPLPTPLTDCSLGEVQWPLEGSGELRAGGLYLMPEVVTCNGDLVLVETCAFLNRLMNTSLFRLRVVVYRERTDTHELDLIYQQALDITSTSTQDCGSLSRRPRQWSVNKGDRVGVQIRDTCDTPNGSDPACPAQANLIDAACASALFLPPLSSPCTLSNFTAVGVNLNVRVSIVPTTPAPQPSTVLQPVQSSAGSRSPQSDTYSFTLASLLPASSSRSEATPDMLPPSNNRSLQTVYSSKPGTVSNTMEVISHGVVGGIVVAALVVTTALVILLTISTYVYCTMKHKGKYQYTETNDHQVAVISYHVDSKDEVFVSYEEPADDITPQKTMNHTITSSESSYRESFRNRGYSEPNAYSEIGNEVTTTETVTVFRPYSGPCSEPYVHANAGASVLSHSPPNKIPTHYEVDKDYEDPYWEPSSREDELRRQLLELKVQEIPRDDLQLHECLGSGQFGTVNRGVWSPSLSNSSPGVEVAVKSLEGSLSEEERVKFLQEAVIMGQFKHPNIIRVIGVITTSDPFLIVCEMMHKGDLHHHLLSLRPQSGSLLAEMPAQLLSFSRQVAFGMTYLSNKSFVHRDLAARNILVSEYDICKIADFGLSRDLQKGDYYVSHGGKIPVKWTAPEALNYRKYSASSDVWSYGVLLYEIWAMGIKPFHNCTNNECLKKVLAGYRLPPPPGCPRAIYEWMMRCWHPQPESRPTFTDTLVLLQRPDFQLLRWSAEDEVAYSEKARTLGGPVEDGSELFAELQEVFSKPAAS